MMAILKYITEKATYTPYSEKWELENGLKFNIYFDEKIEVHVASHSGDVSDQIYNKLVKLKKFNSITLRSMECYYIGIDKELIKDFMNAVELMDCSELKQGKVY